LLVVAVSFSAAARADTIVLKNGRHIAATAVTRKNGNVSYETDAGWLSLPDSIVERVEKGGDDTVAEPGRKLPESLAMKPSFAVQDASNPAESVVHDGAIDNQVLRRLDEAAASGTAETVLRAALAESVAGQFELDRGNFDAAFEHADRAVRWAPAQPAALLELGYLHLRRGQYAAALDLLDRARRVLPDSPEIAMLTGWADYGLNRLPQAVDEWKRSQQLRPDPQIANALEKAEHDLEVESSFHEGQSAHFTIRYYGGAAPDLARASLRALEDDFQLIADTLNYTPSESIAVVLYTNETFKDITRAPLWVGALNDGRIRVPVQGLVSVTPELARVFKHELTHTFLAQKTQGRCPVWLQEGIAQWMEGSRSTDDAAPLVALYDHHQDPSLTVLEGSWMNGLPDIARIYYGWSLAVVEALVAKEGVVGLEHYIVGVGGQSSAEAAARRTLHMSYQDLNRIAADYLRRTYLH
jgi:tetratricopeptide (TPR) repeat protein